MKKRITDNTCSHGFEISQIVKVDRIDGGGTVYFRSGKYVFDNDDCEDFDDYKPGDKIRIKQDTHLHGQTGNLVTITNLTEGYCADGSRSYMTDSAMFIPEHDFDCYEGETYVNQKETTTMKYREGDIVKIVAMKSNSPLGRHDFKIGEVVRIGKVITGLGTPHYRAEYLDEHDFWYVLEEEVAGYQSRQKETETMEYKEGDIVKIVARKHGHGFYIGEIIKITKKDPDGAYYAEYLDGHDFWLVGDDEIEPANNITTRPHDYTGCDPEIAEALKQGLDVYCEVWDNTPSKNENIRDWVIISYQKGDVWPYECTETVFAHARPVRQEPTQEDPVQKPQPKTKLVPKPASEIFAWLENPENGYYKDSDGDYLTDGGGFGFIQSMIKYCGTDDCGGWSWNPEWLREVPVEVPSEPTQEPVSETSENPTQYSIGDIVEVTGDNYYHNFYIGDIVEIVAYDSEDDDYKCKRQSDDKFQWLRTCDFKLVRSKPRTATVIHKSSCQLLPGQKVTVIKRNEAGNFLCESDTGSQIWMQPEQIKFD